MTKRIEDLPIGAKVQRRNWGRPVTATIVARILQAHPSQRLILMTENGNISTTGLNGKLSEDQRPDLDWIPAKEKRSGWMNIYPIFVRREDEPTNRGSMIWDTKEQADADNGRAKRIDCIQVEWEE